MANNYSAWQNRVLPSVKQNPVREAVQDLIYQDRDYDYGYKGGAKDYSQTPQVSTFWHDPTNVANYYNLVQNNQYADWMDDSFVNFIEQAYGLYEIANNGANWEEWKPLQLEDPARQFLGSFNAPPEDYLMPTQKQGEYPEVAEQNYTTGGLTQAQWDALPPGQKALYNIFSSPQKAGAVIGGGLGLLGGPVGGAVGASMGAGLGTLADKFPWLGSAFDKLDILAEGVERFLGAASLVTGGDVRSFDDLEAAWKAGHLTYDVARIKDEQIVDLLEQPKTVEWSDDELIYEAYDRIRKGEDVDKVYESIQERTGFSGQMRDLMGHIVFDPLNLMGAFALKGGGALTKLGIAAGVLGDAYKPLSNAFDVARGITDVIPKYGDELRAAMTGVDDALQVSDLNKIQRWAAGFDAAGTDLRYAQAKELTGVANVANRLGGAVATGGMTSIIGAGLFGVPGAIISGGLGALFGAKRGLSYMANLTPAARSTLVVDNVSHFLGSLLSKNTTVIDGVRVLDKHAYAKHLMTFANNPRELVSTLSMKMFGTPDAAAMPLFLKGIGGKIDALATTWDATADSRRAMQNISKVLDKSVDDVIKMMRDAGRRAKKGVSDVSPDVNKLDILFKQIDDAARKTGNDELVKLIDEGGFTKDTLNELFKTFVKDDNPATETAWIAKSTGILLEETAVSAAKYYNVKPDPAIIRMSTALKNAQSLVLLGLNPNYLVNNFVNNMVTMASDGVIGFRTTKAIDNFWARVGIEPPRLRQGVTAIGDTDAGFKTITEAQRVGDWIDVFGGKASSATQKFGKMATYSQNIEAWSSAQALTSAFKRSWDKIWRPGKGFDALDGQLQQALGPEMTEYIHSAIRNGLNKAEIEDALWSGYSRKMADDFMPAIAERLGMRTDDARGILRDLHIDEFLRENLLDSMDNDGVIKVFDDAVKMAEKELGKLREDYLNYRTEQLKTNLKLSGGIELFDVLAKNSTKLETAEIQRWASNERTWRLIESTPDLTDKQKSAIWREHYLKQKQEYAKYEAESLADLKAVIESIDDTDGLGKGLIESQQGWHDNWKAYFDELAKMQEKVFKDKGDQELAFREYERQALDLYRKHVQKENDIEVAINALVEKMIRRQHGDQAGDATIAWRTKMIQMRQEMRTDLIRLREQLPGKTHGERSQLWKEFIGPHQKKIHDYHTANFDDANGVYDATRAAGGGAQTPSAVPSGLNRQAMPQKMTPELIQKIKDKHAGWKLHLASDKPEYVSRWLKDRGYTHKVGRSGQEGKDLTVYIGSKADTIRVADDIENNIAHLLNDPHGETLTDDIAFTNKVWGRFSVSQVDTEFHQYGSEGIPYLNDDMARRGRGDIDANTARQNADRILRERYGEFYSGESNIPNAGVSMPMGFGDSFQASPSLYEIFENGWSEMAMPLLEELRMAMLSDGRFGTTLKGANIDATTMAQLKAYLGKVYGQMGDAKNMALKYGEQGRDFALLNYQRRTGFDTMLTAIMPYQFWYSRSMMNWARRAIERPGYLATWGRLHAAQQQNERKQGYPSRLDGKIQIEMPFLPDWMGDSVYIDPMRQLFPIELLLEPFQKMAEDRNAIDTRTRYILEQWYADDKYTKQELEAALNDRTGKIWDEAVAQAKVEVESEFSNPMDFMTAISGTLLPIQWAHELISGTPEKIGSLPVTRAIQALTAWATPGGMNAEAPIRKLLGLPVDGNEYMDYYIRREIPWVGIMGGYSVEEIQKALVDRTGPLYELAVDYVGKRQSIRYFASALSLDFFPEGEQEMRALHEEFRAAIEADTVSEFFDKHPEYSTRALSYSDDPEEMLRRIAVSAIWEMRGEVPTLTKNRLDAAFGEEFQTSFLNKETRSIDSIDTETLLSWAQALGAELPDKAKEYNIPQVMADVGTPAENQVLDWYYQQREQLFGNITATQNRYYALPEENRKAFLELHPELRTYWDWNKGVKQQYPRLDELTREKYERDNLAAFEVDPNDFSAPLTNRMLGYFYSAQPLGSGARSELNRLWIKYGRPTETLDQFIELLRSYFGQ